MNRFSEPLSGIKVIDHGIAGALINPTLRNCDSLPTTRLARRVMYEPRLNKWRT